MREKQKEFEIPVIRHLVVTDTPICLGSSKLTYSQKKTSRSGRLPRFSTADICCVCMCDFPCICPGDCSCPCGNVCITHEPRSLSESGPVESERTFQLKPNIKVRKEAFGGLVGDVSTEGVYVTNESGIRILSLLKGPQTAIGISNSLKRTYRCDTDTILSGIKEFFSSLLTLDIISIKEESEDE